MHLIEKDSHLCPFPWDCRAFPCRVRRTPESSQDVWLFSSCPPGFVRKTSWTSRGCRRWHSELFRGSRGRRTRRAKTRRTTLSRFLWTKWKEKKEMRGSDYNLSWFATVHLSSPDGKKGIFLTHREMNRRSVPRNPIPPWKRPLWEFSWRGPFPRFDYKRFSRTLLFRIGKRRSVLTKNRPSSSWRVRERLFLLPADEISSHARNMMMMRKCGFVLIRTKLTTAFASFFPTF